MMNNILELMIRRSRQATPSVPMDYVFYAPLATDLDDHSISARTCTEAGYDTGNIALVTKEGLPCVYLPTYTKLTYPVGNVAIGGNARTFSIWYYPNFEDWGYYAMLGMGGEGWKEAFEIAANDNKVVFGGRYEDVFSDSSLKHRWNHIAVTYDGTTINVYHNGELVSYGDIELNTATSDIIIGGRPWDEWFYNNAWFSTARIYNRALSASEILSLYNELSITYQATLEADTFDFYPSNTYKALNYNTFDYTPTFEIVSGTLPNTITFDTVTGTFEGTAPLDSDHVYTLSVRVSAPNCLPATATITLQTHATARIEIESTTFGFVRDGLEDEAFSYFSDESVTFSVESGYSLPSGITMSDNRFYSDGTTAAGTYTVVVRGTSTHNQTGSTGTMTINVAANVISISTKPIKFYVDKGAYSKPLKYTTTRHAITPVYSLSGTLPTGITFNSQTGEFSSDGLQSAASTATVSVTVASSTGLSTADTENVEIDVEMVSVVPSDYIWYTPFTTDYEEETSGIVGVPHQQNAFSIATDNSKFGSGFLAARKTQDDEYGIEYANTATYMDLSAGNISVSLWLRAPNWSNYSQLLGGTRPYDGADGFVLFADFESEGVLDFRSASNDSLASPRVNLDSDWHHYVFTRNSSGDWAWWKDGVASTSGSNDTGSINGTQQNMKIGGGTNWSKCAYFDLVHFRVYDRVLNSEEIEDLYTEF